ncbi:hypothetical protein K0M31_006763 [Melipona bicolor]|uniref:Uncharacterized protein n=1 Tax=Melipona bicolor TaxID=60889 RepID=A0AA40FSH6_9HYME|nr:hypothetical protein K0M31_006763 [Melipona bicolor]
MITQETKIAFKVVYALLWIFFTSYYFWGIQETTVTSPIDESGWIPDGAFANEIMQAQSEEQSD